MQHRRVKSHLASRPRASRKSDSKCRDTFSRIPLPLAITWHSTPRVSFAPPKKEDESVQTSNIHWIQSIRDIFSENILNFPYSFPFHVAARSAPPGETRRIMNCKQQQFSLIIAICHYNANTLCGSSRRERQWLNRHQKLSSLVIANQCFALCLGKQFFLLSPPDFSAPRLQWKCKSQPPRAMSAEKTVAKRKRNFGRQTFFDHPRKLTQHSWKCICTFYFSICQPLFSFLHLCCKISLLSRRLQRTKRFRMQQLRHSDDDDDARNDLNEII